MSVGSKIKSLRKKRGMTQSVLADGIITRGMLSRIEIGTAMPSMHSLNAIASKLEVSSSFLIEDGEDILPAEQARVAKSIEKEYRNGNYSNCLNLFEFWHIETDAKFAPIFVSCAFESAKKQFQNGNFKKAIELLSKVEEVLPQLLIPPVSPSQKQISLLYNIIEHIDSIEIAIDNADDKPDFNYSVSVFFTLLKLIKSGRRNDCISLMNFCDMDRIYTEYINALTDISNYKFIDAMLSIKAIMSSSACPVFLKLLCLSSLENCCKLCDDYKGAYENHLAYQEMLKSIIR